MVRRHHDCALRQPEDSARALISDHSPRRGSRHLATAPALDAHSAAGTHALTAANAIAPSLTFKADRANRPGQNDLTSHHQHPLDRDSTTEHFPAMNYRDIITIEAGKRSGKPCIRGMRITVTDVLEYLASGMSIPAILTDFPELTEDDIRACLAFAADRERRLAVIGG